MQRPSLEAKGDQSHWRVAPAGRPRPQSAEISRSSASKFYSKINSALDPNSNDPVVLLMRAVCSGFAERRSWQLAAYKCKRDCSAFVQSKDRASA